MVRFMTLFFFACYCFNCSADNPSPDGKGINVLTRYMQLFSTLENELSQAIKNNNPRELDHLLSPFFELRRANGVTLQRQEWLKSEPVTDNELYYLSVYEVGDTAVANFSLRTAGQADRFIIDIWQREDVNWTLRVRFENSVASRF